MGEIGYAATPPATHGSNRRRGCGERCGHIRGAVSAFLHDVCAGPLGRLVTGAPRPPSSVRTAATASRTKTPTRTSPREDKGATEDDDGAGSDTEINPSMRVIVSAEPLPKRYWWLPPTLCGLLTVLILAALSLGLLQATFVRDIDDVWVPPQSKAMSQKKESEVRRRG